MSDLSKAGIALVLFAILALLIHPALLLFGVVLALIFLVDGDLLP